MNRDNPVTPGQLLPVREMLGDLYLELGNPKIALAQYEKCLINNPN
ncbi:MAG: tetratricopeptide repeat protein [Ignavibacteriae bacterium]|nr:tetratricopeptide repeat protein [Ignavibacteriota bacterium]